VYITLSNNDDTAHPPKLDAPGDQKVPASDDVGDDGALKYPLFAS
jgi:hypothetical protein